MFTVTSWNRLGELSRTQYREGYKKAADTLTLKVLCSDGDYMTDLHLRFGMIYPIMFLYRHYIEIELKDLLALAGMMSFVDARKISGHGLMPLWAKVLKCVEEVQGTDVRQEFEETFQHCIELFEQVDPQGDAFRYPKDVKGNAQWDGQFEIDIAKIKSDVDRVNQCCYELRQELRQMLDPEAEDTSERDYFY